jgi:hypothetical protein
VSANDEINLTLLSTVPAPDAPVVTLTPTLRNGAFRIPFASKKSKTDDWRRLSANACEAITYGAMVDWLESWPGITADRILPELADGFRLADDTPLHQTRIFLVTRDDQACERQEIAGALFLQSCLV